ncbi:hypothetical protein [Streptomyces sp. NEAU-S7GS2]|uniref:hypothetical protein n=1 Tax=Streptomyces sp. NEAU-S7GS2 TaxID=2202000 RepID=UPI000D6F6EA6|nr:hypothetical protein [Streptomyces sp. NEAU-S7GS2]AWN32589.1 hypothetical protein DKG71_42170 [Streptomyces sp. NEAU-S7GS2]
MPKKQPTAAKRARAAARTGAKYTAALRQAAGPHLPPHLEPFDDQALPEGERLVVDCLRALAAEGRPLPVRMAEPDPEVVEAQARAEETGVRPQWRRWASVQAAVDGYVLRETQHGPNRSGYTQASRGPRVPVPVRAADGTVTVVAMPEWAWLHEGRWIWAHTGWPVETPGQIVDPPQEFSPAPGLRWQVAVWLDLGHGGKVQGEDYGGSTSDWQTVGWCTSRDDARLIARAYTAHRDHYARADVIEHGTDNGVVSLTTDTYLPAPDAPERPRPSTAPGPRPASPDRAEVPEPAWYQPQDHPPNSSLVVWTGTGWRTLAWTDWQTGMIAQNLGIGAGGPYEWGEAWGPRHPDRDMHDWTQEGRELHSWLPEPTHQECTELIHAARRAREDALVVALADRGGLTREQALARLTDGGEAYREVLDVGQAVISRALHTARRALPEGESRTAVRHALDDLMARHLLPADAARIAVAQLDTEVEAQRSPEVTAWCRKAVAEYIAPSPDPVAANIDGFHPRTPDCASAC